MLRILFFLSLPILLLPQTLAIASWNVENLFDMHYDGLEYAEYVPGRHGWSEPMLRSKLRNISEVICDLDADVIGLQEVENDRILSRLQKRLKRAGCAYPYRAITGDNRTPIHNALLSRIPIKRAKDLRITRYGRQRSALEAVLGTDPPLRLFVNHWRSKRGPESDRVVYAKALKKRLDRLPKGAEYFLLGDFNSHYNESITIDKKHNDTHNVTGINTILKTMVGTRMVRLDDLKKGQLASLWMELPSSERWSHNFFGDKQAIDAMLIPSSLHDGRGWEYRSGSFRVYRPKYLFGRHGAVKRWSYKHGKHLGKGYSDHLPIVAVFDANGTTNIADQKRSTWFDKTLEWFGVEAKGKQQANIGSSSVEQPQAIIPAPATDFQSATVSQIKKKKKISKPLLLKNAHVVFKRRESAVIQQARDGEAILLYRSALQLEEGHCYDLKIYRMKRYNGLPELTDVEIERALGTCDTESLIPKFHPSMLNDPRAIGGVARHIQGVIQRHSILIDGTPYRIHFRKGAGRPRSGTRLMIDRAQIGYYKDHTELVVWSKGDYHPW